jgi:hypothetical protein
LRMLRALAKSTPERQEFFRVALKSVPSLPTSFVPGF